MRDYPGLGVEDAVRRFVADEATDVGVAQAVTEPDTATPTRTRLHTELRAALGDVPVWFCDRHDALYSAAVDEAAIKGQVIDLGR